MAFCNQAQKLPMSPAKAGRCLAGQGALDVPSEGWWPRLEVFPSVGLWAAQISPAPSEEWGCKSHTPVKVRSAERGACGPGHFCANKEACPFDARAR